MLVTQSTELSTADDLLASNDWKLSLEILELDQLPGPALRTLPRLLCLEITGGGEEAELDCLDDSLLRDHINVVLQEQCWGRPQTSPGSV